MNTQPLLEVVDLHKTYRVRGGTVDAVAGVTFDLRAGQTLGIVGESGSGKSTVARMLVGLEQPDAGRIVVCGRATDRPSHGRAERLARARSIQIVFQDPYLSLDPRLPVGAAIESALGLHTQLSPPDRRQRVIDLLVQVGLGEGAAPALPRRLSGGERQRVAIARALAVRPSVLVLDEAVSALDVSVQAQVLNLLADIRRETGVALVFISHDLAVVRHVCDQTLVMHRGQVVERGATQGLLDSPQHPYTQLLRDAVPRPGWSPEEVVRAKARLGDESTGRAPASAKPSSLSRI
ncbi:MAG TPA: ATP-binding cassette domain-containing protein [Pedococcus sp.]|nr:ATP-binding cassette domain-containing protein [Pedococcus sp.]